MGVMAVVYGGCLWCHAATGIMVRLKASTLEAKVCLDRARCDARIAERIERAAEARRVARAMKAARST